MSAVVFSADGVIVTIGVKVLVPSGAVGRSGKNGGGIRVDESAPTGVIIPALQVVEAGFLDTGLAVGAKWWEIQMGKTGTKSSGFLPSRERGYLSRAVVVGNMIELFRRAFLVVLAETNYH